VSATTSERSGRASHLPQMRAAPRDGERVTPLELFFDLVFVLALTQCTTLIAREPTWLGVAKGRSCSRFCGGRGAATPG
jgi:low temperature requirement protein LtrA